MVVPDVIIGRRSMHNEKVFTPSWMVSLMLNKLQYSGHGILQKHIIDNSCGKGVFLVEAVERYCKEYNVLHGNTNGLKEDLETYIHGIEIDETCWGLTVINLNRIGLKYDIEDINWDIIHGDALEIDRYNGKMDYVVGNPPYCNIHDFGDKYEIIKKFSFAQGGMADLYLVFFEIGINMLNKNGKLIYITPSSRTTSIAGKPFRKYLIDTNKLSDIVVLGHEKVFKDATTFTIITEITNNVDDDMDLDALVTLYRYEPKINGVDYITTRPLSLFTVGDKFYFTDDIASLMLINDIEKHEYEDIVRVKNGFATLNDKLFVMDKPLAGSDEIISCVKASTGELKYIIFPYDRNKRPLEWHQLSQATQEYLEKRSTELDMYHKGKKKGMWWLYGRTQAINDVGNPYRYSINNLIRTKFDVNFRLLSLNWGVYSGFYIVSEHPVDAVKLADILYSDEFSDYVKVLGRYKNGGYYTFTSKELQNFINYKLWQKNNNTSSLR